MKRLSLRELWALPELALVRPLLAAIDSLLASLRAQHGTLQHEWQPGDPPSLCAARALTDKLLCARRALQKYARAARHTLRDTRDDDSSLPF